MEAQSKEKRCRRCQEVLLLSMFNKRATYSDGLDIYCRKCANAYTREAKAKKPYLYEHYSPTRQPGYYAEFSRKYATKYPLRLKAAGKLGWAIRTGTLARIDTCVCSGCGAKAQEYHHMDYNKPLDVVPMCKSCHRQWHLENKPIEANTRETKERRP